MRPKGRSLNLPIWLWSNGTRTNSVGKESERGRE
jgi:hypothetical protein